MLTLTIVRHAKSSWGDPDLLDIDRPLNARGKTQTVALGTYLATSKNAPDLILCSAAKRARQTLKNLMKGWKTSAQIIEDERLYLASPRTIIALLDEYGETASQIMIIGHNPGLHMLANMLADKGKADDMQLLEQKYPTGAICVIQSKASQWKKIDKTKGKLLSFVTPKTLASKSETT